MKVCDLIAMLQKECSQYDEVYITDAEGMPRRRTFNPDISVRPLDPTEQDEYGGWKDLDGEPIVGKPVHIF